MRLVMCDYGMLTTTTSTLPSCTVNSSDWHVTYGTYAADNVGFPRHVWTIGI